MWVKELSVLNFKNYEEASLAFSDGVNAFTGNNGAGKTNLLDALHYLSLGKSYFNPIDSQQIRQQADFFMVQGRVEREGNEDVLACSLKKNQKKQFKCNKKEYERLADHIGRYPLVMISPNDGIIITEGSEERRRFMDNVISQTDTIYLNRLIKYNKLLLQRNQFLKQQAALYKKDRDLLDVYDEQLIPLGDAIYQSRLAFMKRFVEVFNRHYAYLSDQAEQVELHYESQLEAGTFASLIKQNMEKDYQLERSTVGIHKDDLIFSIHGMPMKKFGSQGQQKSFLIALKLAQYSFLHEIKGFKPLLLLDDIFDKLDSNRTTKLMKMVSEDEFGQIFITDTDRSRVENTFEGIETDVRIFAVDRGSVSHQKAVHGQNQR